MKRDDIKLVWRAVVGVGYMLGALIPVAIALALLNLIFGHAVMNAINSMGEKLIQWVR